MTDSRVRLRSMSACVALAAMALLASCAPASAGWQSEMISSVNAERAAVGAAPLAWCASLERAAQLHSEDQAASATMSHTGSDGSTMTVRVGRAGYINWTALAENVAAGYPDIPAVMSGWLNSSGHRTNLLNAGLTHIGVGRAQSSSGAWYWTQNFGVNGSC